MDEHFVCRFCGSAFGAAQLCLTDGQAQCPDCLTAHTVLCGACGARIWLDDNARDLNTPLCRNCYDGRYENCVRCGSPVRSDAARYLRDDPDGEEPHCDGCYRSRTRRGAINGASPRYLGVELEIHGAGNSIEQANRLLALCSAGGEFISCRHNGSLDDGFEIVTRPMTCEFHRRELPWAAVLAEAAAMGYTSHKSRNCGLHVHVNRTAFGDAEAEQDVPIARILYFFEKHWEELLKFSRRTEHQLKRWAARYGYREQPMDILARAKKGHGGGRYSSVNLQNRDTVEFRIFRGTLKYNTLIATLQLVDQLCDVAIRLSDEELKALSWTSFVSGLSAGAQPELIQYLKERRLYVNEPVNAEEDL